GLGPSVLLPLKDTTGTVVLWQRLDRILGYKQPYGEMARKKMSQLCRELEIHLSMVFHRFLTGGEGCRKVSILLNGNKLIPWDPFCRDEPKTRSLQMVTLTVEMDGVKGEILLQPYILPRQDEFSTPGAARAASGPQNWNQQQGIYIYRAGRMVQSGGWCRLRIVDEHTKLARLALSFKPKLDEAFKVNVAKMRAQLPVQVRQDVERVIAPLCKLARERYDKKPQASRISDADKPPRQVSLARAGEVSPTALTGIASLQHKSATTYPVNFLGEVENLAIGFAEPDEKPTVKRIFRRIHSHFEEGNGNDI
ncbi:MAG: hypothetical protein ACRDF4_05475, partial [Rhabdochlamydiaceae bacterium]